MNAVLLDATKLLYNTGKRFDLFEEIQDIFNVSIPIQHWQIKKKIIIIIITSDLGYSKTVKEYPGGSVGVFSHLILNWNS